MENTIQRIKKFIDYKGISVRLFERNIGMSNGSFASQLKNNKTIGVDKLENILHVYEDLDPEWLLTGKGNMLKSESTDIYHPKITEKNHDEQYIPLYEINAAAGLKSLFTGEKQNIINTLRIPNLSKVDGAIFITGDSMYPLLKSGDIVVFKQIHNIEYLHYGDIYILSYEIDGDEYLVVKYVNRSDKEGHIKLVSYNTHHTPIDIPVSSIIVIALVKANIRYNTMT